MIQVTCPSCGRRFETDDQYAGAAARCPNCGADLTVPAAADAPPTVPPGPYSAAYAPPPPSEVGPERTSPLAIWALVLGLTGLAACPLAWVGLILGIVALSQINKPGSRLRGHGMAIAGIVLGAISFVIILLIVPLLVGIMLPALGAARRTANQMKNSTQLRGQHQSMVIYAQGNNSHLPGLDAAGKIIPDGELTGYSGPGSTASARYWIILNEQYLGPEMVINPVDGQVGGWWGGAMSNANHSYAMLSIHDSQAEAGRLAEWKDTANSQSILISDRNTGPSNADTQVQSLWTSVLGDWKGNLVWGDNHAEFAQSHRGFATRYLSNMSPGGDNLFADGPHEPGASESGTVKGSNAYLLWD